ncbi:uncharacterized protein LOC111056904 [Nilaparvata lugens]|uniref:uncharacterized protein LOC111056904 n=1 Tax=Nilaparvata lugens TaxID=108931 RepID=UPI00193D4539|nr:uncharacterized protein LOC111056904 [Nilaparvata lugens]
MEDKLKRVLTRIVDKTYSFSDDSILAQLQKHLADHVHSEEFSHWKDGILLPWCLKVILQWESMEKNIQLFIIQVVKVLTNNQKDISKVLNSELLDRINDLVKTEQNDLSLMLCYTELMTNVVKHIDGVYWFMDSDSFKLIISEKRLNKSLYFSAQEKQLLVIAITVLHRNDSEKCFQLMDRIMEPLGLQRSKSSTPGMAELFKEAEKYFLTKNRTNPFSVAQGRAKIKSVSTLSLLSSLVDTESSELDLCKLLAEYNFEAWIWRMAFSNATSHDNISSFVSLIIRFRFSDLSNLSLEKVDEILLTISYLHRLVFLNERHGLAFEIMLQCMQLSNSRKWQDSSMESQLNSNIFHFLLIPLQPFLNRYMQKYSMSITLSTRTVISEYPEIFSKLHKEEKVEVIRSTCKIISRMHKHIDQEKIYILVGIFTAILETFQKMLCNDPENESMAVDCQGSCVIYLFGILPEYPNFLMDICSLLEVILKAQVTDNWRTLTETEIVFYSLTLVDFQELDVYVKVRILSLVASILDLLEPTDDPARNDEFVEKMFITSKDTLLKNLCHPKWEIRDSVIEVIKSMAVQGQKRLPKFVDFIVELNVPTIVCDIAFSDDEVYAQKSALQCLQKMVQSQRIWNDCLLSSNLLEKIMDLLNVDHFDNESTALVRKEQISLITEIYEIGGISDSQMNNVHKQLVYSAIDDLYWEVKVSALRFWKAVMQTVCEDNNLVDGLFPSDSNTAGQSKCNRPGNSKSKLMLKNILDRLYEIGCLQVLWETLNDACDLEVSRVSASILTNLVELLKRYNYLEEPYQGKSTYDGQGLVAATQNGSCNEQQILVQDTEPGSETKIHDDVINYIVDNRDSILLSRLSRQDGDCPDNNPRETAKRFNESRTKYLTVDEFLSKLCIMNLEEFIQGKDDWMESTDGFNALMDTILGVDSNRDQLINAIDCY